MSKLNLVNKAKYSVESALFFDKHDNYNFMKICENIQNKFSEGNQIQNINIFNNKMNSWHNNCRASYHAEDINKENTAVYKQHVYDVVNIINESMSDDMLSYIIDSFGIFDDTIKFHNNLFLLDEKIKKITSNMSTLENKITELLQTTNRIECINQHQSEQIINIDEKLN